PQRKRRNDPGNPEICNVWKQHHYFNPDRVDTIARDCRSAALGCVDCKGILADGINRYFAQFRERRAELARHPATIDDILADGATRARAIAIQTMAEVRQRMGLR
ncbi:MAG: tryptophan--tRNA ligase, partial [Chloroflexota bacterium]